MSLSFETTIKLQKSRSYTRLVLVLYLLSVALIFYAPIQVLIQLLLLTAISIYIGSDIRRQSPCCGLNLIRLTSSQWLCELKNKEILYFDKAVFLFHNPLFQVIQLIAEDEKKTLLIFNDQLTKDELKMMHLRSA